MVSRAPVRIAWTRASGSVSSTALRQVLTREAIHSGPGVDDDGPFDLFCEQGDLR